ncbi:MAG: MFS transporter [Promethearchaeota archaeon]
MEPRRKRKFVFILPFIGDFTNSMLNLLFVMIGVGLGFSTFQNGLVLSAYGITYIIMPPILGHISDKISHKKGLIISVLGQIILSLFLLFVLKLITSSMILFYCFFIEQLLRGVFYSFYWPVIEAYISRTEGHSLKAHREGINNFCISWGLGMAIAPLIGGLISDWKVIFGFWVIIIGEIFALIIVLVKIREYKNSINDDILGKINNKEVNGELAEKVKKRETIYVNENKKEKEIEQEKVGDLRNRKTGTNKEITIFLLIISLLFALNSKLILYYFPNYAILPKNIGGLGWSGSITGEIMLFYGFGQFLFFLIGRYFKNTFKALISSSFFLACLILVLNWIKNEIITAAILFFVGLMVGRLYYVSLELLMLYEKGEKGKKAGLFESSIGLGGILSPLIAGNLAFISLGFPFVFYGILSLLFFIGLILFKMNKNELKILD